MTFPETTHSAFEFPISVGLGSETTFRYPASEAQLEIWLSSEQSPEANCAYNEISSLNFSGPLNVAALETAIAKVIQRHESLRTVVSDNGHEMVVLSHTKFSLTKLDLSNLSADERQAKLECLIKEEGHSPFDLNVGPLFRATLQKIDNNSHKLTVTAHHIVLDGWSLAVLCQDLGHFYDEACGKSVNPLPPVNSYSEYAKTMAAHLESEDGQRDETFWVKQFEDEIPVLDLPISNHRPALRTYKAARYDHQLSSDLVQRLRLVGAKRGCSLFNSMLAAFSGYLSRISGTNDFSLGIPTAGQAALDRPELVGHCVNTMPLRSRVDTSQPFVELLKDRRSDLLNAFEHQKYSYGTLLRKLAAPRDPARPAMLNVSFNVDPMIDMSSMGFDGLEVTLDIEPRAFENFEWFVNGVIRNDKSIELQVQYNVDLFSEEAVRFYFEGFEAFIHQLVTDPTTPIQNLNLMSVPQREKAIVDFNQTSFELPNATTLHGEFCRQAKATPDKVAVEFNGAQLTFGQLDRRSNQIARQLQSHGVSPGDLVGIYVDRSERMLAYLYGILKSGAGYVPLDPTYPMDRLKYMCDHSGLKLVITEKTLIDRAGELEKPTLAMDQSEQTVQELSDADFACEVQSSDICYVIYTSGSTGKPKGVQVPHGCVVNFLYSMRNEPGFGGADESILAVTTLSFDISVLELFLPTIFGGKTVVVDSMTAVDGTKLAKKLHEHQISIMQATPATWRLMIQSGWTGKADMKILCGGEPMPNDLVGPLLERCGELWNMYGPTETTVWSAVYQITEPNALILIGKPIGNTQIYVLDEFQNEVPIGCEGEVYIGGAGVTLGYRNRDDLTQERFVENKYRNPFSDYVSDRLYKTGDLAKFRFDGNIQFLRRNDKQVKVRGFRIELGEIESAIQTHQDIQQTVVMVREDTPGDSRLVAYVVAGAQRTVSSATVREHVKQTLPYYMVPHHVVAIEKIPTTNNGKIDYKSLPVPQSDQTIVDATLRQPQTPAERYLASVWAKALDNDRIGLDDVFFDIGGHSLLVMQVIATVKKETGEKLGPQEFLISTLEQMASKIDVDASSDNDTQTIDTAETSAAEPVNNTPVSDLPQVDSNQSVFRKLTGFWN